MTTRDAAKKQTHEVTGQPAHDVTSGPAHDVTGAHTHGGMRRRGALTALVALLLAVVGVVAVAPAAPASAAAGRGATRDLTALLDEVVARQLADDHIPGASVVLVKDGRQVFAKGYGLADVARGTKVDPDRTAFYMASDAKVFTAVAVLQQVEAGRLDLDADVNRYLTTFKIKDSYPGHPVTVRNLLTHTAGFDNDVFGRSSTAPLGADALGKDLAAHQPPRVRPPGTVASYDNYAVALAGYLVETVTRTPFPAYVQRHILAPLGMRRTTFTEPQPRGLDVTAAVGYRPDGSGQVSETGQYGAWTPTGAGALTTVTDMGKLMNALLAGGGPVLRQKSVAAMGRRQFGNDPRLPGIGFILEQRDRDGHRMLVKDGDLPGFHSNMALLPDRHIGVYVSYNGDGTDGSASYAGQELVNELADRLDAPVANKARSTADAAGYAGEYRSTRTSTSDLTRAAALTSSVRVSAGPDGTLTTTGLSRNPEVSEQHWDQIGPGVFQEHGGQDRIAFRDHDGMQLTVASDPTVAYQRLPWYASPVLHQYVLLGTLVLLLVTVLVLPVLALVRRRRAASWPLGARVARVLCWSTGALLVAATVCFMLLAADSNALNRSILVDDSPLLTAVPALTNVALGLTGAMLLCTVLAWRRRWWRLAGRLHYTLSALSAAAFLAVCASYQLVV